VRGGVVGLGLAVALAVSGCTAGGDTADKAGPPSAAASAPAWSEPAKYEFVLNRKCGDGPSDGLYQVDVAGGQVVSADRIDGKTASGEEEIDPPTLRELLDMAQTATDDGAQVTTELDKADGHPVSVSIDTSDGGTGADQACFVISDYKAG
jgi:hypothetical protein